MFESSKCPHCGGVCETNFAETMADLLHSLRREKGIIVLTGPKENRPLQISRVKLALDFGRRGPGFVFRAVAEGWDCERLVKELY